MIYIYMVLVYRIEAIPMTMTLSDIQGHSLTTSLCKCDFYRATL